MRNNTEIFLLAILSALPGAGFSQANPVGGAVASPDGKLVVGFSIKDAGKVNDALFWKIDWNGQTVMEDSRLGFTLDGAPALDGGFKVVKVGRDSKDTTWKPPYGEASKYRDHYNEMRVTVQDNQTPPRVLVLSFRAYDEGAAFRTTFPKQEAFEELAIKNEDTQFRFTGEEPYLAFFRALPTVWDEKVVIQGEIGEFITLARRKGDSWFVGTMNAVKSREVDIPLSFLPPGKKYKATIYSDDPSVLEVAIDPSGKGKGNPESEKLKISTMDVTSKSVVHARMANNGGQAIHIVPAK